MPEFNPEAKNLGENEQKPQAKSRNNSDFFIFFFLLLCLRKPLLPVPGRIKPINPERKLTLKEQPKELKPCLEIRSFFAKSATSLKCLTFSELEILRERKAFASAE